MNELIYEQLALARPTKYLLPKISSYANLLDNLTLLRHCSYQPEVLDRLLKIITANSGRFRKNDCFALLKRTVKKAVASGASLNRHQIDGLFEIFSKFVLTSTEQQANDLSVTLRDQALSEDQISWLLTNAKNVAVLNRILRYPICSQSIAEWAQQQLLDGSFADRESELVARVLDIDPSFNSQKRDVQIWAIYHSRLVDREKIRLLRDELDVNIDDTVVQVCTRLGYFDLLEEYVDR